MAIELKQQLKLSQQLVMTPQLQQAIKLLQLSRLELVNLVSQELQENPVLEEAAEADEEPTPSELSDQTPGEDGESGASAEAEGEVASAESADPAEAEIAADLAKVATEEATDAPAEAEPSDADKIADVEWDDYMDSRPQTGLERPAPEDDERRSVENSPNRRPSLAEHLEWQLTLSALEPRQSEVARWIIGNLDEDGYLRATPEEISRQCGASVEEIDDVLQTVRRWIRRASAPAISASAC